MAASFRTGDNRARSERKLVKGYMALARRDPRLLELLRDIMEAQPTTDQWYSDGWRDRVKDLAGWHVSRRGEGYDAALATSEAHDVVYGLCYSYCYDGDEPA